MKGSTANRVGQTDAMGAPLMANQLSGVVDTETLIRSGFIRKVYGILSIQLMATFGEMAVFVFVNPIRAKLCAAPFMLGGLDEARTANLNKFCIDNESCCVGSGTAENPFMGSPNSTALYLMYGSMIASFALVISLVCCIGNARIYPRNMILLSLFTLAQGTSLGVLCAFTDATAILMATGLTAIVVLTLTVFARYTTIDFTGMGIYLYVCLVVFIIAGFIAGFFVTTIPGFRAMQLVYAVGGVLLFSCYLVYDTQLIIGGKHAKFQFSVDDYVFAALNLYLDIINLFLFILQIINNR